MKCTLTGDEPTRWECFSGLNDTLLSRFDTSNPQAPTRTWKKVCPTVTYFKDGFYISRSGQVLIRPWCEDCYRIIQNATLTEVPEKIRKAFPGESSYESIRKAIRKRFGFSIKKNLKIIECMSRRFPTFSEEGLFAAAFIAIAIAKVKGLISSQDLTVKKTPKGLFIQEFDSEVSNKIENGDVFDSMPNFSEPEMIDFLKSKTDWSLKNDDESYSLEELANQYYLGLGEIY